RAPTSTVFPYTTLFRSLFHAAEPHRTALFRRLEGDLVGALSVELLLRGVCGHERNDLVHSEFHRFLNNKIEFGIFKQPRKQRKRSEEHTSELQSRFDLV